jgi:hypothetical protein
MEYDNNHFIIASRAYSLQLKDAGLAIVTLAAPFLSLGYIQKHPTHVHTSYFFIRKHKQKHPHKDLLFVRIRNSLTYLHLVLSTPRGVGKQGIRHNNLTKEMNIMMWIQSTTSYECSNTMVNA